MGLTTKLYEREAIRSSGWLGRLLTHKSMSWKNIKDHYKIGHTVQIREGRICIGSAYISDLICVSFDGQVTWGTLGRSSSNDDLCRYYDEMVADLTKVKQLIDEPDTFTASLPVYTYDGGNIIEKQCEAYGYPNITHDGDLMYENTFSDDKNQVIAWAKRNAFLGVKSWKRNIAEAEKALEEKRGYLAREEADLAKLESDYPDIALPKDQSAES